MYQSFVKRTRHANEQLNRHCMESGYETFRDYYAGLHPAERRPIDDLKTYISDIADATTNPAVDYDGTISLRTSTGLVVASQFFHTFLSTEEITVYANRLREDSLWMRELQRVADIGFLLDRSAPEEYGLFLEPSPWLQDSYGDLDPDFMRGVYYACRLAKEAVATVELKLQVLPGSSDEKEQT